MSNPDSTSRLPSVLKSALIRELKRYLSLLEEDRLECTASEAMQVISQLCHEPLSREQVLIQYGLPASTFSDYVSRGLLPKGRKRQGFKELVWYRDELNDAIIVMRQKGYNV